VGETPHPADNRDAHAEDTPNRKEARQLLKDAVPLFQKGSYDEAEKMLTRALNLYPFMAETTLYLGKIFLLKGSALRDEGMLRTARLMFQMAHQIDPDGRDAALLLQLFGPSDGAPLTPIAPQTPGQ
jgi:tetratricopeptide (TPR) repeat protein